LKLERYNNITFLGKRWQYIKFLLELMIYFVQNKIQITDELLIQIFSSIVKFDELKKGNINAQKLSGIKFDQKLQLFKIKEIIPKPITTGGYNFIHHIVNFFGF
jgi:hypothetical protein